MVRPWCGRTTRNEVDLVRAASIRAAERAVPSAQRPDDDQKAEASTSP